MSTACNSCGVRDRALCGTLTDDELADLSRLAVQRSLSRGETLLRAGDPALVCANVESGVLKIASVTAGGSEAIVGLV